MGKMKELAMRDETDFAEWLESQAATGETSKEVDRRTGEEFQDHVV